MKTNFCHFKDATDYNFIIFSITLLNAFLFKTNFYFELLILCPFLLEFPKDFDLIQSISPLALHLSRMLKYIFYIC